MREVWEFDVAFTAMVNEQSDAVILQGSLPRKPAIDLALQHHIPLVGVNWSANEGGLMSYSLRQDEIFHRAAYYVDRILKGARPADLPVEEPTHYEFIVNLKTAKVLGLTVPPTVLGLADKVIEQISFCWTLCMLLIGTPPPPAAHKRSHPHQRCDKVTVLRLRE